MDCCAHLEETDEFFDRETARDELRDYRRDGIAKKSGRLLVEGLKTLDLDGKSHLDVGGGIGAIPFDLCEAGVSNASRRRVPLTLRGSTNGLGARTDICVPDDPGGPLTDGR